jgi:hypothetical protein
VPRGVEGDIIAASQWAFLALHKIEEPKSNVGKN